MTNSSPARIDFNTPQLQRKRRIRALKDRLTNWYVLVGGLTVLATITLIFFYLAYVVTPLFQGAELNSKEPLSPAWLQDAGKPLLLAIEEQNQIALRISERAEAVFFAVKTGNELRRVSLPIPAGAQVVSLQQGQPGSAMVVLGLSNGQAMVLRHAYKASYPDGKKTITPELEYPYGETALQVDPQGRPLEHVNLGVHGETLLVVGSSGNQLHVLELTKEENQFTGETSVTEARIELPQIAEPIKALFIDVRQNWLFVVNGRAQMDVFNLPKRSLNGRYPLLQDGTAEVTTSSQLRS
jgi:phosphate transport system permease protein